MDFSFLENAYTDITILFFGAAKMKIENRSQSAITFHTNKTDIIQDIKSKLKDIIPIFKKFTPSYISHKIKLMRSPEITESRVAKINNC